MRNLLLLMFLGILFMPYVGCGGTPDPRDREEFVDTTDPGVAADMLEKPGEQPKKPAGTP